MCVVKLFSFDYFLFGIQSLKFEIGDLKAVVMIFFLYKIEILFYPNLSVYVCETSF